MLRQSNCMVEWKDSNTITISARNIIDASPVQNWESVDAFWNVQQGPEHGEDAQRRPQILRWRTDHQSIVQLVGRQLDKVDEVQGDIETSKYEHGGYPGALWP